MVDLAFSSVSRAAASACSRLAVIGSARLSTFFMMLRTPASDAARSVSEASSFGPLAIALAPFSVPCSSAPMPAKSTLSSLSKMPVSDPVSCSILPCTVGSSGSMRPAAARRIGVFGCMSRSTYSCPVSRLPVCRRARRPRFTSAWKASRGAFFIRSPRSTMRSGSSSTTTGIRNADFFSSYSRRRSMTDPTLMPLNSTGAPIVRPRTESSKKSTKRTLLE